MTPNLQELLTWVDGHINYERNGPGAGGADDDPSRRLRHVGAFLELIDNPQSTFPSVHITGTNGKTSTSRLTSSLFEALGLSVGTYTSPHLVDVNERIVTNGEAIYDDELAEVLESLRLLEPMVDEQLSYFELFTVAALRYFADKPVNVAVIEVGVGGKWDATNVIDGAVAVVTNVGLDHMNYLGPTRRDIAEQKAGIIKPESDLVLGETDPEIAPIFVERPHASTYVYDRDFGIDSNQLAVGGRLLTLRTPKAVYDDVFLSLHGRHQGQNAALALMAAQAMVDQPLADDVVREAFGSATSPGRMEVIRRQPLCLVDGAHNAAGATALVSSLDEEFGELGRVVVVGMLAPHDPAEMLAALEVQKARLVVACSPDWPRAVSAEAVADAARGLGATAVVVPEVGRAVEEALAMAKDDEMVLVTGSLYVVGAARAALSS